MLNLIKRKKTELCLVYAISFYIVVQPNSKMGGLQKKLKKVVRQVLHQISDLNLEEQKSIIAVVEQWGEETGWLNSQDNLGTLIFFCLSMLHASPIPYPPAIYKPLRAMIQHLKDGDRFTAPTENTIQIATDKWNRLFNYKGVL